MDQKKIDRISELTRISRERELSGEEKEERLALRQEYIASMRESLKSTLDNTYLVDGEGTETKLEQKKP